MLEGKFFNVRKKIPSFTVELRYFNSGHLKSKSLQSPVPSKFAQFDTRRFKFLIQQMTLIIDYSFLFL